MAASSSSSSTSSTGSPCAGCKLLRRKCTVECVFAPYFPPDNPQKFANVHKIFGASNVSKLLNDLSAHQREDAVNSLAFEAEARVKDPIYGCVGTISVLQRQISQLQQELAMTHSELARLRAGSTGQYPSGSIITNPSAGSSSLLLQQGLAIPQQAHQSEVPVLLPGSPAGAARLSAEAATLLDQLQRDTNLSLQQLIEQLTRAGGGSLEAGLAAVASLAGSAFAGPSAAMKNSGAAGSSGGTEASS